MANRRFRVSLGAPLIALALASGMKADNLAYLFTGTDQFGMIDLDTGEYKQLGNTGVLLSGLGVDEGALYGGAFHASTLYQVNVTDGSLNPMGDSGITYCVTGSTTKGLYAIDVNGNLYSVNEGQRSLCGEHCEGTWAAGDTGR